MTLCINSVKISVPLKFDYSFAYYYPISPCDDESVNGIEKMPMSTWREQANGTQTSAPYFRR